MVSTSMEQVALKNGSFEVAGLVALVTMSIKKLSKDGFRGSIALYELVQLCKNPQHRLFGNSIDVLSDLNLVKVGENKHAVVHQSVRNIVLSMVEGDGLDMTFGDPRACS